MMYKKLLYDFEEIDKNNAETYDIDKSIVENNKWILEDKIGYDINIGKYFNGDGEEVQLYWVSFDSASYISILFQIKKETTWIKWIKLGKI